MHKPFNEGRGLTPGDTSQPRKRPVSRRSPFNEGRGLTPGDTDKRLCMFNTH